VIGPPPTAPLPLGVLAERALGSRMSLPIKLAGEEPEPHQPTTSQRGAAAPDQPRGAEPIEQPPTEPQPLQNAPVKGPASKHRGCAGCCSASWVGVRRR
jgi:hypothetical protein